MHDLSRFIWMEDASVRHHSYSTQVIQSTTFSLGEKQTHYRQVINQMYQGDEDYLNMRENSGKYVNNVMFQIGMLTPIPFANRFSVVENRFKTGFQFDWPLEKLKFQAQLNLVIFYFFGGHI